MRLYIAVAAFGLATVSIAILCGKGVAQLAPLLLAAPFRIGTLAVFAAGFALGAAGCTLIYKLGASGKDTMEGAAASATLPVAAAGATLLMAVAVSRQAVGPAAGAIGLILAVAAMVAAFRCAERVRSGEPLGFESHWGGLGGGSSGWRLLPGTGMAFLALAMAGAAIAVTLGTAPKPSKAGDGTTPLAAAAPGSGNSAAPPGSGNSAAGNEAAGGSNGTDARANRVPASSAAESANPAR